jgi:hypothetical protein
MKILSTKRFNKSQATKERQLSYIVAKCVNEMNDNLEVYHFVMNNIKRAIKKNDFSLAEEMTKNYTQR